MPAWGHQSDAGEAGPGHHSVQLPPVPCPPRIRWPFPPPCHREPMLESQNLKDSDLGVAHRPVTSLEVLPTASRGRGNLGPQEGVRHGRIWGAVISKRAGAWPEGPGMWVRVAQVPSTGQGQLQSLRGTSTAVGPLGGPPRGLGPPPLPGVPRPGEAQCTRSRRARQDITWVLLPAADARELWLHAGAVVEGHEGHRAGQRAHQEVSAGRGRSHHNR